MNYWNISLTWRLFICLILILPVASLGSREVMAQTSFLPASTINFGETVTGSISVPGEIDAYSFSANTGDTILIGISRVSGNLWPRIRLNDPSSRLLDDESNPVHAEISQVLPDTFYTYLPIIIRAASGTTGSNMQAPNSTVIEASPPGIYTILVSDGFNGTFTGSYNLYIQRLNNPAIAINISFGQTISGSIIQPAEMDTFTFNASANDMILLGMSQVSGNLWQEIRLYGPNGNLLNEVSNPVHTENIYRVPVSGQYRVLVTDGFNGTFTGSYNLYIQRLNNPANAISISFGQTIPGSITQPAEMDTFTFNANANATVLIGMTHTSGALWPKIRIYDPGGNLLAEDSDPAQANITQSLPVTGRYTILASDGFNGTFTGSYNLSLQ